MGQRRNPFARFSFLYYVLLAFMLLLFAGAVWMGTHLFTSGKDEGAEAKVQQRVATVDFARGVIEGVAQRSVEPVKETPVEVAAALPVANATAGPLAAPPGLALSAAPAEFVTEQTEAGPLPRISREGVKPWRHYGRDPAEGTGPRVAVLLTSLGLSESLTNSALELPPEISLSFSPYTPNAPSWAAGARAWGHEIFVDLPLEPERYPAVDPGPKALFASLPPSENNARLRWVLTRFPGYVGLSIADGEKFTQNAEALRPVFQFLSVRGLMLVGQQPEPHGEMKDVLSKLVLPLLNSNVSVLGYQNENNIRLQLLEAENLARREGQALAVIPASPLAIKLLKQWVEDAKSKGYFLVPVSTLARSQFS